MDPDKISIGLKDNAKLAAAFAGSSAGDTVKMTIEFIIDESATDMVVGSLCTDDCEVTSVTDGPDDDENSSTGEASGDIGSENVLSVMSPGYKNKK